MPPFGRSVIVVFAARERARRGQEDLRSLLLGFDVEPHDQGRVLDDYLAARLAGAQDGAERKNDPAPAAAE